MVIIVLIIAKKWEHLNFHQWMNGYTKNVVYYGILSGNEKGIKY